MESGSPLLASRDFREKAAPKPHEHWRSCNSEPLNLTASEKSITVIEILNCTFGCL
jgi:hypothetical protein